MAGTIGTTFKGLVFCMCSFFLVCKHLPVLRCNSMCSLHRGFNRQRSFADLMGVLIWETQIPVAGS